MTGAGVTDSAAATARYTINETAELLRVSRRTVYRLVAEKRLRVIKIGGSSFVLGTEVERYLALAVASLAAAE